MSQQQIEAATRELREAEDEGLLTLHTVWSPADTVADTRYQVSAPPGSDTQILFHREVAGFLAGVRKGQA